jgi:hypothetical protein
LGANNKKDKSTDPWANIDYFYLFCPSSFCLEMEGKTTEPVAATLTHKETNGYKEEDRWIMNARRQSTNMTAHSKSIYI